MIIGVSGKICSGKDTVYKIIQYLTSTSVRWTIPFEKMNADHTMDSTAWNRISNWENKKFADKLKQCVSIITGIPKVDLEKEEVKTKLLGEEWTRYGYADSFYRDMNGTPIMNNKQCSKEEYIRQYKINEQTAYKHEYTVREILQLFGTEVGRQIHYNVWVNALFSDYDKYTSKSEFTEKPVVKLGDLIPQEPITSKHNKIKYKCFCGKYFKTTPYKIEIGHTKSCGCYQRARVGETKYKDGRKGSRLWTIYNNMIQRCENPNHPRYSDYGARGITVSDSFKPFENFKSWAELNGYNSKVTLDRIEVNDIYCPDNCRFVSYSVQAINTRNRKDNTSGYRGVSFEFKEDKWRASIQIDGKIKFLGYFLTPLAASIEYEKWYNIREEKYIKKSKTLNTKNWVITDVRFPNELKAIKDRCGITIRINRNNSMLDSFQLKNRNHSITTAIIHPSETALDNATFDYTIDNNGTIKELVENIRTILIKEKIL